LQLQIIRRVGEDEIDGSVGSFAISATQSPTTMRGEGTDSKLTRAPLRTPATRHNLTQNSDSGDAPATRDLQPTKRMMPCQGQKRVTCGGFLLGNNAGKHLVNHMRTVTAIVPE